MSIAESTELLILRVRKWKEGEKGRREAGSRKGGRGHPCQARGRRILQSKRRIIWRECDVSFLETLIP